jgi:hypothetical protein
MSGDEAGRCPLTNHPAQVEPGQNHRSADSQVVDGSDPLRREAAQSPPRRQRPWRPRQLDGKRALKCRPCVSPSRSGRRRSDTAGLWGRDGPRSFSSPLQGVGLVGTCLSRSRPACPCNGTAPSWIPRRTVAGAAASAVPAQTPGTRGARRPHVDRGVGFGTNCTLVESGQ